MRAALRAVAAAALAVGLAACGGSGGSSGPTPSGSSSATGTPTPVPTYTAPPASLPAVPVTLTTAQPPWGAPILTQPQRTADYVAAAGLPYAEEMLAVHYHAHLDITVDGKPVVVSQYIGYVANGNSVAGLAPLHTHDNTGIIHIENSVPATFYLGQFFIEWGVKFTPTCLGPYCTGNGKELAVFVNGTRYSGDPTTLVLKKHQEIAIEYGDTGKLPKPPSSYTFPSGL